MTLKQLRMEKGLTQAECAKLLQVSLRTYKRYESDESKIQPLKYQYLIKRLTEYGLIDEEHGILTIEQIKNICSEVFKNYSVEYCYLLVSMSVDGMKYFELIEILREKLKKKIDLIYLLN